MLTYKVNFDTPFIKMSAAIGALCYTKFGSVKRCINKLLHGIYSSVLQADRKCTNAVPLNCSAMAAEATGVLTVVRLKAESSCSRARMWLFIKPRRKDLCTNTVRDVAMTTANLPPIQWRQQNLTLSLPDDGLISGAMQWIRRPVIFNSSGLALNLVFLSSTTVCMQLTTITGTQIHSASGSEDAGQSVISRLHSCEASFWRGKIGSSLNTDGEINNRPVAHNSSLWLTDGK